MHPLKCTVHIHETLSMSTFVICVLSNLSLICLLGLFSWDLSVIMSIILHKRLLKLILHTSLHAVIHNCPGVDDGAEGSKRKRE